jgi:hypothetical protein
MQKTTLLILFLFSCVFLSKGQNEIYKTAKWVYYLNAIDFHQEWYDEMTYEKDTTINGETWQKFKILRKIEQYRSWSGQPGYWYFTENHSKLLQWVGNKVYYLPQFSSSKYLLYDFDAQPGGSWEFAPVTSSSPSCQNYNLFFVDSSGTEMINGHPVKWVKGWNNHFSSWLLDTNRIYQNMGMPFGQFEPVYNPNCVIHPPYQYLVCYYDSNVGWNILDSAKCERFSILSIEEPIDKPFTLIFPNPTKGKITIQSHQTFSNIHLYDMAGKLVWSQKFSERTEHILQLENLASGVYGLFIDNKFAERIILE